MGHRSRLRVRYMQQTARRQFSFEQRPSLQIDGRFRGQGNSCSPLHIELDGAGGLPHEIRQLRLGVDGRAGVEFRRLNVAGEGWHCRDSVGVERRDFIETERALHVAADAKRILWNDNRGGGVRQ